MMVLGVMVERLEAMRQERLARKATKDRRCILFEERLKAIASKYEIGPRNFARLLEDREWRELYAWKEAPEFIERIAVGEAR